MESQTLNTAKHRPELKCPRCFCWLAVQHSTVSSSVTTCPGFTTCRYLGILPSMLQSSVMNWSGFIPCKRARNQQPTRQVPRARCNVCQLLPGMKNVNTRWTHVNHIPTLFPCIPLDVHICDMNESGDIAATNHVVDVSNWVHANLSWVKTKFLFCGSWHLNKVRLGP